MPRVMPGPTGANWSLPPGLELFAQRKDEGRQTEDYQKPDAKQAAEDLQR